MTEDPFETIDGAYVVGSLSAADRELFEAHLESCDACMQRVAALWAVPDLLDLAPIEAFKAVVAPAADDYGQLLATLTTAAPAQEPGQDNSDPAFPEDLLPSLLQRIGRQRHRRRILSRVAAGIVAACVLALAGVIAFTATDHSSRQPTATAPTVTVANATLAVQLSVTSHDSWDEVNLTCTYKSQTFVTGNYTAIAKDKSGRSEVVGSWPVIPGQTAVVQTPTTFHTGEIASVSIIDSYGTIVAQLAI